MKASTIWTVGHSTRTGEKFKEILLAHEIQTLVDVRAYPGSRRYPHFNKEELSASLERAGINYHHEPRLGGRRQPRKDSKNTRWREGQFRGYADHMETDDFAQGISVLLELAKESRTVYMCSEAVWWRCHRSLISDYLRSQGHTVLHILDANSVKEHLYTSAAWITLNGKLSYRALF